MSDGILLMIDEEVRKKAMGAREGMRRGKVRRKGNVILLTVIMRAYLRFSTGTPHVRLVAWQVALESSNRFETPTTTGLDKKSLKQKYMKPIIRKGKRQSYSASVSQLCEGA